MIKAKILILVLITIIGLSIGYSAFNQELMISGDAYVRVAADIRVTNISLVEISNASETYNPKYSKNTTSMFVNLTNKSSYVIYEITITNNSNIRYQLTDITSNQDVSYELEGIGKNELILADSSVTFQIKICSDVSFGNKELIISYEFSNQISPIIADKNISERTNFTTAITNNTDGTIYRGEDNDGTTYYFAGNTNENWVYFAGYYWRIIRINGDGSVRLIYSGQTIGDKPTIGASNYNVDYLDNTYVGYMYGSTNSSYEETHANINDSTIKTIIDNWYEDNLINYENYLSDSGFCVDRTYTWGTATGTTATTYSARNRLYENKNPSFKCSNEERDLFTLQNSDKGNQALTYLIGLITADEIAFAGGGYNFTNEYYYLYADLCYWTMTPNHYNNGVTVFRECSGVLNFSPTSTLTRDIRPVINLKADIMLEGSGTSSNPYRIVD